MPPATYLLKAPPDDMARWKADAARGVSFAEHVRRALDAAGGRARTGAAADSRARPLEPRQSTRAKTTSTRSKTRRTSMCEHRVPPGAFCSRCDR